MLVAAMAGPLTFTFALQFLIFGHGFARHIARSVPQEQRTYKRHNDWREERRRYPTDADRVGPPVFGLNKWNERSLLGRLRQPIERRLT